MDNGDNAHIRQSQAIHYAVRKWLDQNTIAKKLVNTSENKNLE
jgi:hypothetical protein